MLELKANPKRPGSAYVLESQLEQGIRADGKHHREKRNHQDRRSGPLRRILGQGQEPDGQPRAAREIRRTGHAGEKSPDSAVCRKREPNWWSVPASIAPGSSRRSGRKPTARKRFLSNASPEQVLRISSARWKTTRRTPSALCSKPMSTAPVKPLWRRSRNCRRRKSASM